MVPRPHRALRLAARSRRYAGTRRGRRGRRPRPAPPGRRPRTSRPGPRRIRERRVVVRVRELAVVADPFPDRERLLVVALHRGEVALPPADATERLEQTGPEPSDRRATRAAASIASSRRRASSRWPCFCQNRHMAKREPDRHGRLGPGDRPVEDRADVVVGELEPLEPAPLLVPGELRRGRARPGPRTTPRWRASDRVALAARLEPLRGVLADRLEQPEPRLAVGRLVDRGRGSGRRAPSARRRRRRRAPSAGPQIGLGRLEVGRSRRRPTAGRAAGGSRRRAGRSSRRSRRAASAAAPAGRGRRPTGRRAGARAG